MCDIWQGLWAMGRLGNKLGMPCGDLMLVLGTNCRPVALHLHKFDLF